MMFHPTTSLIPGGNGAADGVPGSSHPNQGKSEGHGKGTDNGHTNGRWAESDGVTTQFGYDGALRLTQATGGTTESYAYDPASNLTQLTDPSVSQSISVNQLNEIQSVNGVPYVYDANGNLLDDGMRTYTWDAADRLLTITDKATGHVSGFAYDGLSRRVWETETDVGGASSEAHLLWCGQSLCEKRGADDSVLARYFLEGEWRPGQPLLYVRDQVDSVVAVVDASGAAVGRLRYSSYGTLTGSEGLLPDFRYAGLIHHQASGLELATYRSYAPTTGKWLSRDPIGESDQLNMFAYGKNIPTISNDKTGDVVNFGGSQPSLRSYYYAWKKTVSRAEREFLDALEGDPTINVHIRATQMLIPGSAGALSGPHESKFVKPYCAWHDTTGYNPEFSRRDWDVVLNLSQLTENHVPVNAALYHEIFGHDTSYWFHHGLNGDECAANKRENSYRARVGLPPYPTDPSCK